MSRPTVWGEVWNNFWASLSRGRTPPKKYIGVGMNLFTLSFHSHHALSLFQTFTVIASMSLLAEIQDPTLNGEFSATTIHRCLYTCFSGYDAHAEDGPKPSVEWLAWISGTRRFPPSNEEIALNKARAQVEKDARESQCVIVLHDSDAARREPRNCATHASNR